MRMGLGRLQRSSPRRSTHKACHQSHIHTNAHKKTIYIKILNDISRIRRLLGKESHKTFTSTCFPGYSKANILCVCVLCVRVCPCV